MLHGWDPIAYLNLEHVERIAADVVIEETEKLDLERRRDYFKAMMTAVQGGVAKAFGGGR